MQQSVHVLLVDDQRIVGAALSRLLASESDIALHCCYEPAEAVACANEIAPAVILQDLVMPRIDGFDLVIRFRRNARTALTPIVVLSGNDDSATRTRALAAGADDYLVKLPSKDRLIECIRRYSDATSTRARDDSAAPGTEERSPAEEALHGTVLSGFQGGTPDFLRGLRDQFLQEATAHVRVIAGASNRHDPPGLQALQTAAHSLKGASSMVGAKRLAELCEQLEQAVKIGGSALDQAMAPAFEQELRRVRDALTGSGVPQHDSHDQLRHEQ
jgi:CheY-like chemotaxis protein